MLFHITITNEQTGETVIDESSEAVFYSYYTVKSVISGVLGKNNAEQLDRAAAGLLGAIFKFFNDKYFKED